MIFDKLKTVGACLLLSGLLQGCSVLKPPTPETVNTFILDAPLPETRPQAAGGKLLMVAMPQADAGFDTPMMAYTRRDYALDYFTRSQWADTPARMLQPMLVRALESSGMYAAVMAAPNAIVGDQKLDLRIIRFQHEFDASPSRVRLTARAQIIDTRANRVLATRTFNYYEAAATEDAYGGVIAMNTALGRMLADIVAFCGSVANT